MKEIFDPKTKKYFIAGVLLIAIYFAFFYLDRVSDVLSSGYKVFRPMVYGLVIAFIINLPMNFFHDRVFGKIIDEKKHRKLATSLSLIISWIIFFGLLSIVLTVLIPELTRAITVISTNMPAFISSMINFLNESKFFVRASNYIVQRLEAIDLDRIGSTISMLVRDFFSSDAGILNRTGSIINSVSQAILALCIGFVFSLYVSMNKKKLKEGSARLIFANFKKERAEHIIYVSKLSYDSFARFLETRLLSCLSLGIACFIGMSLFRMPSAGMISILIGSFDIIPYIGAFSATVIGMILIFTYSPRLALVFLIFVLILQQVQQQIFYPLVIGKHQGLPAIWIFVSVIIGGGLLGLFGMVAFIPLATVLYTLLEDSTRKKLKNKDISNEDLSNIMKKSHEELRSDQLKEV
ncbi:AI-2E family transporter [uncultured Anaerococcus sp.]|uniref:AI-2E family transporter n=1 Tax=uncultured Anaerococcus sp. TaxID=293428 RepID=UPI0025E942B5|nr:AI-2E family transporter [uncultured Anaerococcus sp.]